MTLLLFVGAVLTQAAPQPTAAAPPAAISVSAEEKDLDIIHRQIAEEDYRASRALRLLSSDGNGVSLDVGAALAARRIQITLRNVRGHFRFRSRFEALHPRWHALPDTQEGAPSTPNR